MEEIPTGAGMDLTAGKNGAPALCHGVPISAVISTAMRYRDFLFVRMVWTGSAPEDSFRTEVMFLRRGILYSSIGEVTEVLTMWASWRASAAEP